jgi:hypothetical protein
MVERLAMNYGMVCRLLSLLPLVLFLFVPDYPSVALAQVSSIEARIERPQHSPADVSHEARVVDALVPDGKEGLPVRQPLTDETGEQVIGEKVCSNEPGLLMAEGSNRCEIVSCGMGIKQTCKITCPAGQTPKCSCDCERSFGPICTDYKANCRCE